MLYDTIVGSLVDTLNRSPLTHTLIKALRLRPIANAALQRVPLVRTLPSGVRYRLPYLDSIALAEDLFGRRIYDAAIPPRLSTFCDLGSNVGQFVALVADRTGSRDVRGLAVDADPAMVRETSWVVRANGLDGVHPVVGLVGDGAPGTPADFYLHPARIKSSRFAVPEPGQPEKGDWIKVRAAYVDIDAIWRGTIGDVRCDLLKIDIEGGEDAFVREDNPFLARVDRVVIEVHKWIVDARDIVARLSRAGFEERGTLDETEALAVLRFARAGLG